MAAVNKYFLLHAGSVLKMWNFLLCLAAFAAPLAAGHEQGQWAQLYDTLKAEVADLQALKAEVAQLRARNELLSNSLHDARRNLLSVEAPPKMSKINWNSYVGVNIKQKKECSPSARKVKSKCTTMLAASSQSCRRKESISSPRL